MYRFIQVVESWASSGSTPYVTNWEAWNEPDSGPTYAEPATAAAYYAWALQDDQWNNRADQIAAGSFNSADAGGGGGYVPQYIGYLKSYFGGAIPIWSIHPYDDVTCGNLFGNTGSFNTTMANNRIAINQLWLTEAADWLDDPRCPSSDGNSTAQSNLAEVFQYEAGGQNVTQEYWYQFAANGTSGDGAGWDSGLLDGNTSAPSYNQPRYSYCHLTSPFNPGACNVVPPGDPNDHWSG